MRSSRSTTTQRYQVLLFPGIGCTPPVMRWFALELRVLGDVSVISLPGYSSSAGEPADLSPRALAEHVLSTLDEGELERLPLLLIGHSAGCQIAAEVAARVPAGSVRLVLIGPTTDPRARGWSALALRWLRTARHEPISLAPVLVRSYRSVGLRNMFRALGAARKHDLESALDRADCAVLVLRGRRDAIAPDSWSRRLIGHRRIDARMTEGAHMIVMTSPRAVAAQIATWLGTAPSGNRPREAQPSLAPARDSSTISPDRLPRTSTA